MSVTTNALRELHRIHRQLTDLRGRLEKGPQQVAARQDNLSRMEQEHTKLKETLTKTRVLADEKQLQLRQREDRIADLRAKLNGCSSNREYQTLQEQIAADIQANSVLSDEILEALERIDQHQEHLQQSATDLTKSHASLQQLQQRVDGERAGLQSELERVTAELKRAEATLPSEIRAEYFRITRARGEDALAPVEGTTCGSCFHVLSPQTMNELSLGKLVFCKSCGTLLYAPEDTNP